MGIIKEIASDRSFMTTTLERPPLTTTIRGQQYRAENFSKTAYIALASLIREKGRDFPNLNNPAEKKQLSELLLERLSDDAYIRKLSYWLLVIFPSLPSDLVWYDEEDRRTSFGLTLEPEEVIQITFDCTNALKNYKDDQPKSHGFSTPRPKKR